MARRKDESNVEQLTSLGRYSDPAILILTSLAAGPQHGYALIKDIEEFASVTLVPGTLYGALDRLASYGFIERLPAIERRHPYQITATGIVALRAYLGSVKEVAAVATSRLRPLGAL